MAALTGQAVNASYKDLLQVSNSNAGVDATLRTVSDGEDTGSGLTLSTGGIGTDVISEKTTNNGVTVDGVLIKDTTISFGDEALGNYDEGTFTPTLGATTSDGTPTYTVQVGTYTRVGDRVWIFIRLLLSANTGISGSLRIRSLPFTVASNAHPLAARWQSFNLDVAGGYYVVSATPIASSTDIRLDEIGDNVALAALSDADIGSTSEIIVSGHYEV